MTAINKRGSVPMTEPVYVMLGARIQMIRKAIGMDQATLAKRSGLTRTSVTNLEAGRQRVPLHRLEAIAEALSTTPRHILRGIWT